MVRPHVIGHPVGGTAVSIPPDEQVPLRTFTVLPPSPHRFFALAAAAAALTLLLALLGVGSPDREGGVTVLGVDPLSIDFGEPVTVDVEAPAGRLAAVVSIGGLDVARVVQDSVDAGDGRRRATFDLSHVRYLVAGRSTLSVATTDGSNDERVGAIEVDTSRSGWISAPAIGSVVIGLAALAYGEAMLAPARRGRIRIHHLVGLAIAAATLGVAIYSIGWVIGAPEPAVSVRSPARSRRRSPPSPTRSGARASLAGVRHAAQNSVWPRCRPRPRAGRCPRTSSPRGRQRHESVHV